MAFHDQSSPRHASTPWIMAVIALISACSPMVGARLDTVPHGAIVSVPPRPSDPDCQRLLSREDDLAARIRAMISVDGVNATTDAADRAVADKDADYAMLGIALTPEEVEEIRSVVGVPDPTIALAGLVAVRSDVLGTIWFDAGTPVVSVLTPDTETLRVARCLEPVKLDGQVRYVTGGIRPADLAPLADRIDGERSELAGDGIDVRVVEADPTTETVTVGVAVNTPDIEARLVARYGSVVRVAETAGPRPAWPPAHEGPGG